MPDHLFHSIGSLQLALRQRDISSTEFVETLIERTARHAELGAYVNFDPQALRMQAREADARLAAGEAGPLLGVPIAVKDNIDVAGVATSNGTTALLGKPVRQDADVVVRLRAAGALIAGKTNMHELALGITTRNAVTGTARNPWAPDRIPGGSSGGSGVAVAAGMVPAALGTDTGGSVRVPSALCGIAGLRPSVGRMSGRGIAPISATRDTAGPMAHNVEDLMTLDGILAGDFATPAPVSLQGLRLGLPRARFWESLDRGVAKAMDEALARLKGAGVVFVDVALPDLGACSDAAGFPIALHEFVRDLGRYLEESGHGVTLAELVARVGSRDVAGIVQPLLAGGAVPEAAYREALAARARLQAIYADGFKSHEVQALLFPTTPLTARVLGDDDTVDFNGERAPAFPSFIRNTDPGSNAGIPGVSLPAGLAPDGLPVGLALDGPAHSDRQLLAIAAAIGALLPAPRHPVL
ncbi:MAG TPA: indoleacetamide hydrolase [Burkholderiaceae bacterium]|nr:indoleacetamide hydrolase [Burkholderiaceae bacterium]